MPKRRRSSRKKKRVAGGSLRGRGANTRKTRVRTRKRAQSRAKSHVMNAAKKMRAQKYKSQVRLNKPGKGKSKT